MSIGEGGVGFVPPLLAARPTDAMLAIMTMMKMK
jgi:hypothetical protein